MPKSKQHSYTTEQEPNPAPETSLAERARTLLHLGSSGVLSTHSQKQEGFPFGSIMPYALDPAGRPIFLISAMAMHTQNLAANPKASLFVTSPQAQDDPLGAARLTLIGKAHKVPSSETESAREAYLNKQPSASYWVDFNDFSFWRMENVDAYFVGGFGVMGWIEKKDFDNASVDPLADAAPGILNHVNSHHTDALIGISLSEKNIKAKEAKMTAVDRLGFHLKLKTDERIRSVRIGFPSEVRSAEQCRDAMVEMAKRASARE